MAAVLDSDCMLCGAFRAGEVCQACAAGLRRIEEACPACALPSPRSQRCGACLAHTPAFDAASAVFEYGFPLERLMHRFKYAGDLAAGRWLAMRLAEHVADEARPDLLAVPPATRARLHDRGFNPAGEIARVVARRCGAPFPLHLVRRSAGEAHQAGLSRRERLANLVDTFHCDAALAGMDIAVVDDVMTTGATAEAMARALKAAGAVRVRIWTVARTLEPGR